MQCGKSVEPFSIVIAVAYYQVASKLTDQGNLHIALAFIARITWILPLINWNTFFSAPPKWYLEITNVGGIVKMGRLAVSKDIQGHVKHWILSISSTAIEI